MTNEDKLEIKVLCEILSTEIDPESDSYGSIKQSFKDGMVAMMLGICFLFGALLAFEDGNYHDIFANATGFFSIGQSVGFWIIVIIIGALHVLCGLYQIFIPGIQWIYRKRKLKKKLSFCSRTADCEGGQCLFFDGNEHTCSLKKNYIDVLLAINKPQKCNKHI